MSLVNYYKCDICDKEFEKSDLYNFKRSKAKIIRIPFGYEPGIEIKDFDMCKNCLERITNEIKKECAE